jgi:thiol:disulfide interchange protein DsbC
MQKQIETSQVSKLKKGFLASLFFIVSLFFGGIAQAAEPAANLQTSDDAVKTMRTTLQQAYPSTTFGKIESTVIPGVFEVQMGKNIGYSDATGRYFIFGNLFDMKTQTDMTAQKRELASRIQWDTLPLKDAIKVVKGNGKRVFAVFSDPDCPFCKRLESTLSMVDDYTMYVFLFPIESLHPDAKLKSDRIWCAQSPSKAWKAWNTAGDLAPKSTKECNTPIERNIKLAGELGISGTPALISKNGVLSAGALPLERLEDFLQKGQL